MYILLSHILLGSSVLITTVVSLTKGAKESLGNISALIAQLVTGEVFPASNFRSAVSNSNHTTPKTSSTRGPYRTMESEVEIVTQTAQTQRQSTKNRKPPYDAEALQAARRAAEAHETYGRGRKLRTQAVKDKKLRSNLKTLESKYKEATLKAKDAEILLEHDSGFLEPEHVLERTDRVRQDELKKAVAVQTARNGFELKLVEGLGPYMCDYTRNGRGLLLAGRRGHVSAMDWRDGRLGCELQLGETVRDAKFLHNEQFFAVAQKKYTYIYDHAGVELHVSTPEICPCCVSASDFFWNQL